MAHWMHPEEQCRKFLTQFAAPHQQRVSTVITQIFLIRLVTIQGRHCSPRALGNPHYGPDSCSTNGRYHQPSASPSYCPVADRSPRTCPKLITTYAPDRIVSPNALATAIVANLTASATASLGESPFLVHTLHAPWKVTACPSWEGWTITCLGFQSPVNSEGFWSPQIREPPS